MLLWSLPAVVAATLALLAPGLIWAWRCYPGPEGAVRLAVGLALGLALQIHVCALLAAGPGITTLSIAAATAATLVIAVIFAWKLPARLHSSGQGRRSAIELAALVAAIVVPRLVPLVMQQIPQGWDPSFHSLLASTTLASHQLPSWSPYEHISSNYPYGPHVFIAEISLLTGVAPDRVFAVLLAAVAPAITCLALYGFARRALRTHAAALAAVAAYGLLGNFGSIEYYVWGGLPNALGCFMLLVFLGVFFAPGHERMHLVVGGLILGAVPLVHHHVMLTTALLLSTYGAVLAARWPIARRSNMHRRRQQIEQALRRLVVTSGIALASASYYLLPLALRASSLGATRATQYADHDPGNIIDLNGRLLWLLAMIGVAMLIAARAAASRTPPKLRVRYALDGSTGSARVFAVCALPTLLAAFALGYYGYRAYSAHYLPTHEPFTLFTPTRFLTDATYFLAVFAALPLALAWRWSPAWMARVTRIGAYPGLARAAGRVAVRVAIALGIAATTLSLLDLPALATAGHLAPGEAQAFTWIRSHTPPDALVLNLDANSAWAPYFTQREVAYTPVPVSEETASYVDEKRALAAELLARTAQPGGRVLAFSGTGAAYTALMQRPVVLLTDTPPAGIAVSPAVVAGNERVYVLGPAFQALAAAATAGGMRVEWWSGTTAIPPAGWTQPEIEEAGWAASEPSFPPTGRDSYLRIHINGSQLADTQLLCGVSGLVEMWLDGRPIGARCADHSAVPLSLGTGEHVLAVHSARPADPADPWLNVLVLGRAAT